MTLGKRFAIEVVVLYPTIYIHIYIYPCAQKPQDHPKSIHGGV